MTKFPIISLLFPTAFRYHRHTLTTDKHKEGETGPAGGCGCFQGSPTYSHHRQLQGGGDAQLEGVVALRDHRHTLATDKHKEEETGPAGGCGCFEGSLTYPHHRQTQGGGDWSSWRVWLPCGITNIPSPQTNTRRRRLAQLEGVAALRDHDIPSPQTNTGNKEGETDPAVLYVYKTF